MGRKKNFLKLVFYLAAWIRGKCCETLQGNILKLHCVHFQLKTPWWSIARWPRFATASWSEVESFPKPCFVTVRRTSHGYWNRRVSIVVWNGLDFLVSVGPDSWHMASKNLTYKSVVCLFNCGGFRVFSKAQG